MSEFNNSLLADENFVAEAKEQRGTLCTQRQPLLFAQMQVGCICVFERVLRTLLMSGQY